MNATIAISILCGLASALMYASLAGQNIIAFGLFLLAPLPLFVAGLGWGAYAATLAVASGGAALSALLGGWSSINFALMIGIAPIALSHLALLSRVEADEGSTTPAPVLQWYPQGRLAAFATLFAAASGAAILAIAGAHTPEFKTTILKFFEDAKLREALTQSGLGNDEINGVFNLVAGVFTPVLAGAMLTAATLVSFWLGAKIVSRSGRLARPGPHIPSLHYPPFLRFAALASVGLTFAPEPIRFYALCFVGALTVAYFIVGMALLWRLSRGAMLQPLLMGAILLSVPLLIWPAILVALLGIVDQIFGLRERISSSETP